MTGADILETGGDCCLCPATGVMQWEANPARRLVMYCTFCCFSLCLRSVNCISIFWHILSCIPCRCVQVVDEVHAVQPICKQVEVVEKLFPCNGSYGEWLGAKV
jgi:hypothetical protein